MVFALLSGSAFAQEFTPAEGEYTTYIVKWFDDIKSVAGKFGMSVEDLMVYNGLTSEKLEKKQVLKIPKDMGKALKQIDAEKARRSADDNASTTIEKVEEVVAAVDTAAEEAVEKAQGIRWEFKEKVDITLILPLGAEGTLSDQNYDYYSGVLMALKDLGESGTKTRLKVFDSKSPAFDINALHLTGEDIVIGPVEPAELDTLLGFCPSRTAVISPLDPKGTALAAGHLNFLQVPSSIDAQYRDLIEWIRTDSAAGDKLVLITEKGVAPTPIAQMLADSGLEYSTLDYGILEGRAVSNALEKMLSETNVNRAIIASENEAFVNDAVRNLNLMTYRKFNMQLFAPSKIRNYDTVDIESLHNVNAHVSSSYFVDYDSDKVKSFLLRYRALFGAEPTPFAYQGYDTAWYIVSRISAFAQNWPDMLDRERFRGLQSDILFYKADEESGYVNKAVRRIIFENDFSVTLL